VGFLSKLFGREDAARKDASRIYSLMLSQARRPEFYGENKVPDNYDGRIDLLTLHLGVAIRALNTHGEQGKRLAQALYEVMRDDWDIALREEGMSDTGVVKRIKPMIRLFYTRIKAYTEGIDAGSIEEALMGGMLEDTDGRFAPVLSAYGLSAAQALDGKSLGEIALTEFSLPETPKL